MSVDPNPTRLGGNSITFEMTPEAMTAARTQTPQRAAPACQTLSPKWKKTFSVLKKFQKNQRSLKVQKHLRRKSQDDEWRKDKQLKVDGDVPRPGHTLQNTSEPLID
jgi:hypothetical protein